MNNNTPRLGRENVFLAIYIALATVVMVYLVFRAIYVPPLHDEMATFIHYITNAKLLPGTQHHDANNHLLNTWLSFLFYKAFGLHIFVLRLPSLLGAVFFFLGVYCISRLVRNYPIRLSLVLSLLTAPFLIEFLALSRGYGLGMTALVWAVYFHMRFMRAAGVTYALKALAAMLIGVLATLTLIPTFWIMAIVVALWFFLKKDKLNSRTTLVAFLVVMIAGSALVYYAFQLRGGGALYIGGTEGLLENTVSSLALLLVPFAPYVAKVLFIGLAIILLLYCMWKAGNGFWEVFRSPMGATNLLLWGNVAGCIMLNTLLEINFPEDRAALFFFPLLVLAAAFTMDQIKWDSNGADWILMVAALSLVFPIDLYLSANQRFVRVWDYEYLPQTFYKEVLASSLPEKKPTISAYPVRALTWDYYNMRNNSLLNPVQASNYPDTFADWLIVSPPYPESISLQSYDTVINTEISGFFLLKREPFLERIFIDTVPFKYQGEEEFIPIAKLPTGEFVGKVVGFDLNFALYPKNRTSLYAWLVTSVSASEPEQGQYHWNILHSYKADYSQSPEVRISQLTSPIGEKADFITVYIWNIDKKPVEVRDGKAVVYLLN